MNDTDTLLLEHWLSLHNQGVQLSKDRIKALEEAEFLAPTDKAYTQSPVKKDKKRIRKDFTIKSDIERKADKHIDVIIKEPGDLKEFASTTTDKMWDAGMREYSGGKKVLKEHWLPFKNSVLNPDEELVTVVDSILNFGYSNRKTSKKFNLYKQQAKEWLTEQDSITNYYHRTDKIGFVRREADRCRENTLYALNKYLFLKEDSEHGGTRKFDAYDCQAFVLWMMDSGFSMLIGKLRQIGFSTVIGAAAEIKARVNKNFFIKFIAENDRKTEEIFEDKIKYPLTQAPAWFRPTVHNDAANLLTYMYKKKKGTSIGLNSKIMVEPPYLTAINGGSPSLVLMDEIGQIPILSGIILEGRPTLFYVDPRTKAMKMRRQFMGWGTAGQVDQGGGDFEKEFRAAIKQWKDRNFRYGIVPLFIDAFSKPGVDRKFYEEEQQVYYARAEENPAKAEEIKAQFHIAYPTDIEDMFLSRAKTIIPVAVINSHLDRIRNIKNQVKPVYGYYEPVFNEKTLMPESSDVEYKIIGSNFIPTPDFSPSATAIKYMDPELDWTHRYYQGVDPISTETGYSKFASTMWDEVVHKVACQINFRIPNYRYCYQQAVLMNIHYGKPMNLIESNIGAECINYFKAHGLDRVITKKSQVLKHLRSGAGEDGIRKTTANAVHINNKLVELIDSFQLDIDVEAFFIQLKTFTEKVSKSGHTSFGTSNPIHFSDDVIDSVVFAYINAQSFARFFSPKSPEEVKAKFSKPSYGYDENHNIVRKSRFGGRFSGR